MAKSDEKYKIVRITEELRIGFWPPPINNKQIARKSVRERAKNTFCMYILIYIDKCEVNR